MICLLQTKWTPLLRSNTRPETYTDSSGSPEYNLKLSRDRTGAVISWLHRREGIPGSIIVGRGVGAANPIDHNTLPKLARVFTGIGDPDPCRRTGLIGYGP